MSNKGRYFTREIELDSIVRNPLRSNLNANNFTITNVGAPISQNSVARIMDISGGGGGNVWYLYPAYTDISLNCNGIQDVSSITFCGRQTYLRQTLATFDISSNRSIKFNNNQLFLQNNGYIGIGTNTPSYIFDVSGYTRIQTPSVRIGINAGLSDQSANTIAIGNQAGQTSQYAYSIAIGENAGNNNQSSLSIAMGYYSGQSNQNYDAIGIGSYAGNLIQGTSAIAIGHQAGEQYQGSGGISIGYQAGLANQGINSIAIGNESARTQQGNSSIAIGYRAGHTKMGANSIAIGSFAGRTNQAANSIIINASGTDLSNVGFSGLFINPIRNTNGITQSLYYNTSTKEITYGDISNAGSNQWTTVGLNIYNTNYLTGNVAIGTTTPSYTLDVSGSFRSSKIIDVSNSSGLSGETMVAVGNNGGYKWVSPVYGSFTSDLSQNVTADPSNIPLTYNRAEIANLCDHSGAKIYVRRSGIFKFLYSIQYTHTLNQDVNVDTYIRINGVNVPRSNSRILLKKDGFIFPVCEYIVPMNKNDYIEVIAYTTGGTVYAYATEAGLNPAIPSIITDIYSLVTYP